MLLCLIGHFDKLIGLVSKGETDPTEEELFDLFGRPLLRTFQYIQQTEPVADPSYLSDHFDINSDAATYASESAKLIPSDFSAISAAEAKAKHAYFLNLSKTNNTIICLLLQRIICANKHISGGAVARLPNPMEYHACILPTIHRVYMAKIKSLQTATFESLKLSSKDEIASLTNHISNESTFGVVRGAGRVSHGMISKVVNVGATIAEAVFARLTYIPIQNGPMAIINGIIPGTKTAQDLQRSIEMLKGP